MPAILSWLRSFLPAPVTAGRRERWLGCLGAGLAGALAIAAMLSLRCLHPPGGAVALTAVLGGPAVSKLGFGFALWPVAANSCLMLLLALVFNNLAQRRYPHHPGLQAHPHRTADPLPSARLGFSSDDLDAALAAHGELLDISKDDLEDILTRAQLRADRRKWGDVRCSDIMSRDVVQIGPDDTLDAAWGLLARHKIKALPVVAGSGVLVGIVSLHDFFLGHSAPTSRQAPAMSTARRVADIMTRKVRMARPEQPMVDLVALFSDGGLHHMPVVDAQERVVGMITQSDLVAALFKTGVGRMAGAQV